MQQPQTRIETSFLASVAVVASVGFILVGVVVAVAPAVAAAAFVASVCVASLLDCGQS